MRTFNKSQMNATTSGAKRLVSRGVGAGVDLAPVGRIKKFLVKLKARATGNKVADAGTTPAPVRARAGAAKKTVGAKVAPGKEKLKQVSAKRTTAKKTPATKSPAKKTSAETLAKKTLPTKTPAKKTTTRKKA